LAQARGTLDDRHAARAGPDALQETGDRIELLVPPADGARAPGTAHDRAASAGTLSSGGHRELPPCVCSEELRHRSTTNIFVAWVNPRAQVRRNHVPSVRRRAPGGCAPTWTPTSAACWTPSTPTRRGPGRTPRWRGAPTCPGPPSPSGSPAFWGSRRWRT